MSLLEGKSQPFENQISLDDAAETLSDADSCSSGEEGDDSSEPELNSQSENDDFRRRLASIRDVVANADPEALQVAVRPSIDSQRLIKSQTPVLEIPQLLQTLRFTVNCLYRIPIRRPATFDRTKKLAGNDLEHFEPFDKSYIEDRCPAASSALKQRLQRMISRRRRLLHYRSKHYEKIKLELPRAATEASGELQPHVPVINFESVETARPSSTTPSEKQSSKPSQLSKATTFNPADFPPLSTNLFSSENMSVAESLPSTNPSLWTGDQKLYVPPRPKGLAGGGGFLCPYCFVICQVRSDEAWK